MNTIYNEPTEKKHEKKLQSIYGECLEGAGLILPRRALVVVDATIRPEIGDFVICRNAPDALNAYCKQVKSLGETVVVGTCYLDETRDYTFEAAVIDGVVTMVFDAVFQTLIWERSNHEKRKADIQPV